MNRSLRTVATLIAIGLAACSDTPTSTGLDPETLSPDLARVTGSDQASLQDALTEAAAHPRVRRVVLRGDVTLTAPLRYNGSYPLVIDGNGHTITGPQVAIDTPELPGDRSGEPSGGDALVVMGGGDLYLRDVTITSAAGHGVYVEIPAAADGMAKVSLAQVRLTDNGLSGLWIEDQANASGAIESSAGIQLVIRESSVTGNGFAGDGEAFADFDGIRVNEGGVGSIRLRVSESTFDDNAAEGIELDEKGSGSVTARIEESTFDRNGAQPQFPGDLEDGFDIDEADQGGIRVVMEDVSASGNYDEGIDLDEEGYGDVVLIFDEVRANGNVDENIKVSEDAELEGATAPFDGGGDIRIRFEEVEATNSLDDGIQLEEFGPGDLRGTIEESTVTANGDDGLDLTQAADGTGRLLVEESDLSGNGGDAVNADGVSVVIER